MRSLLMTLFAVQTAIAAVAEDTPSWKAYFHHIAVNYDVSRITGDNASRSLQLYNTPLAKWSQPVRGGEHGAVYLWTDGSRPVAAATFFIWPIDRKSQKFGLCHEWSTLCEDRLRARLETVTRPPWDSPSGQWKLQRLQPMESGSKPTSQRIEMRTLARSFSVDSVSREGTKIQLRLLSRPLYEYSIDEGHRAALFAFVHGTDTEVLLLLEPRQSGDSWWWHYGAARMSDLKLTMKHEQKVVWKTELAQYSDYDGPYYTDTKETLSKPPIVETIDPSEGAAQ